MLGNFTFILHHFHFHVVPKHEEFLIFLHLNFIGIHVFIVSMIRNLN